MVFKVTTPIPHSAKISGFITLISRKLQQYYDFWRKKTFEQNHIKYIASNISVTQMTHEVSANQIYCKVVVNLHYPLSSSEPETFLVCPMRDQGKDRASSTQNCNSDTEPGRA